MFKHVVSALVLIISLQGCGGGGGSSSTPVGPPPDTTPPVITISGDVNVNHEQGTAYSDAGATATDNVDGDVSVEVSGSVDDAVAGTYTITYSASDQAGNSSSATRTVQVQDTIPPVITLNGEASITIEQGTVYLDLGAIATDSVDGALDVSLSGTVEAEVGEYTLTYTATDAGGNSASVDRIVTVIEADTGGELDILDVMILEGGLVDDIWGGSSLLSFFDEKNGYGDCTDEAAGTETCASVDWEVVGDETHGDVLQVTYLPDAGHAGLVVGPTAAVDLSDYTEGSLSFDIKIIDDGAANLSGGFLVKVESGSANSGELPVPGINATGEWESVTFAVSSLTASGALNLSGITAPMVFFPAFQTGAGLVYQDR